MLNNPRSQAAIFIVISLVIISSGVLYFFYQRQAVEREIEVVQPEIVPVKDYVESCIRSTAEDGLTTIGLSGGYIIIPQNINNDPRAYLAAFAGGFRIPYWWHDGISAIPTEDFIRRQLESHIKSELKICINNFEPFSGIFEINELKEPAVDVQFNEADVSVSLNYPLEIIAKQGDFKALREKFSYTSPIRFRKVYELAKLIMERQIKDYFLERRTIDLISMDIDIPTTDIEADCNAKTWQLSSIREKLQNLVRVNIPYVRIRGTSYNPNLYVPNPKGRNTYAETYFGSHYVWDIGSDEKKHGSMKVAFSYENQPMEVYARPSENGIMRSNAQKGNEMLSFFCMQIWHFTYDIKYPVTAAIFDQAAEKSKAYQFSFAFKVDIDHNNPNRAAKGTTLFETEPDLPSEDYCNAVQNEITMFTVDNSTGDDLRNVGLTFVCGRYYCDIGSSDWLSFGAAAGMTKRLPYCVNGILKGAKEGYAESKMFIQTDVDGRSYVLAMNPVKEFQNYRVVKHLLSNPGIAKELAPNEKVSIMIKGKDAGYEGFAVYPKEADFPLKIPEKDAVYEVSINVIDEDGIIAGYIGDWKVSGESLKGADEIVFHVVEQGPASEDERFLFVSGLSSYSKNVHAPELK